MDTGVGGSEEAAIHVAELLGQRGHSVSVHMPGITVQQRFGTVTYAHVDALKGEIVDVAVMWRFPQLAELPEASAFHARRIYLWLHDSLPSSALLRYERYYHKIIFPSAYLRHRVHELPDNRVVVLNNGIDPSQFHHNTVDRDPHLIVYGSDYCRGLETLLSCWPTIKEHVPDCRLNVFYGWQGLERRTPEFARSLRVKLDPLLSQAGISHLGRIGHHAVAEQYMRAGVWAYPSWALETFCITAVKAQAGGAVPAVIPTAALKETVRFGFRTSRGYDELPKISSETAESVHGWPTSAAAEAELVAEWLAGLIALLNAPAEQAEIRDTMIPAVKAGYAWSSVVDQWERELADTGV